MKLASVQVLLSHDERKDAIAILENINEKDRSLPGIVSALVTLHMADNDRERASAVLKNAVAYYKKHKVCALKMYKCYEMFFFKLYVKHRITNVLDKINRVLRKTKDDNLEF